MYVQSPLTCILNAVVLRALHNALRRAEVSLLTVLAVAAQAKEGAEPGGAEPEGAEPGGAEPEGAAGAAAAAGRWLAAEGLTLHATARGARSFKLSAGVLLPAISVSAAAG